MIKSIKNIFSKLFNLHCIVLVTVFASGLLACIACSKSMLNDYQESCINRKEQEINSYVSRIVSQFGITDYLNSTNNDIDNELEVASELFGGRIIVVDSTMQIIFDSYHRDTGKTAVVKEIISTFNGVNIFEHDWETQLGTYSYGISLNNDGKINGSIFLSYSLESEAALLERMSEASKLISIIIIIILMFIAFIISSLIVKPIKNMRKTLMRISAGDLDASLEEKGILEFKNISASVNGMMERVRAISENQQEFVSNVSHELKTPMASIKVLADSLLMQEGADEATYREFLTDINAEIDRENSIISDLLLLARMDKKAAKLNVSLCSMNDILNIVLNRVKPLALKGNVEIIYESYREINAEVDDGKLIMALTNFCENAIKYNKEMGQVRVGLNSDARYVYITVEDTGVGIPEDALSHVFERFYRVDKARDRSTGGTGLGLTIANDIIRMHNGVVKVHSKENVGTTFTIRLPLNFRGGADV